MSPKDATMIDKPALNWQTVSSGLVTSLPFERDGVRVVPLPGVVPPGVWTVAELSEHEVTLLDFTGDLRDLPAAGESPATPDPLTTPCPKCLAPIAQRCKGVRPHRDRLRDCGATVPYWGRPRTDAAIDHDCPYCGALAGVRCPGGDYHAARHRAAGQEPPVNKRRAQSKRLKKDA